MTHKSKPLDTHRRAANQNTYSYLSVHLLRNYLMYELQGNIVFRAGSFVLARTHGIPMGGKISAQLATLDVMTREMIALHFSLFASWVLRTRYRDNIFFLGPHGSVSPNLHSWQEALSAVSPTLVTFSQAGSTVDLLHAGLRP